jgi:ankyrin repeat protein
MTSDERPSDRIWKQAEQAVVAGDVVTLDALLRQHGAMLRRGPVQSTWWGGLAPDYSQGDARAIIAREHHFEDWARFAAHAEALKEGSSPAAQFETAVDAVITGDVVTLERVLRENPDLIRARSARRHHSTLLHYIGANGIEGFRQRTPTNAVRVAEILLDAGAEIDAIAGMYGGSDTFGLVATSIHPVTAGVLEELMTFLLSRGAGPTNPKASAEWSGLINACHANGRPAAAELLAARADTLDLEAAAGVGRLDVVRTFFDPDGRLTADATEEQLRDGFAWACEYGRTEVVDFLLQKGIDIAARLRHDGQTGLHWAACSGHPSTVKLLLGRGAPVDAKDTSYGGTPLGWALYGWGGADGPHDLDSRYYEVVTLLVAAGATVDDAWLDESERGFPLAEKIRGDARMRAALRADA